MATTTNYGWSTPDDTSLVKDGAAAIRTLGSSVDTTTKALNPSTTLGDIEYRSSTANTNTRLPLGTAGQVLTVNSGATAPEWAEASGGAAPFLVQKVSNRYYGMQPANPTQTNAVEDTTYFIPVYLIEGTYDRLKIRSGDALSGTNIVRLGIYNADDVTGLPTTLVLDAGTVSVTTNNTDYEITISQALTTGYYYLAFNNQTASGLNYFIFHSDSGASAVQSPLTFSNTGAVNANTALKFALVSSVAGAFATVSSISSYAANGPCVLIRIS